MPRFRMIRRFTLLWWPLIDYPERPFQCGRVGSSVAEVADG
jgi:hypothetical protein